MNAALGESPLISHVDLSSWIYRAGAKKVFCTGDEDLGVVSQWLVTKPWQRMRFPWQNMKVGEGP